MSNMRIAGASLNQTPLDWEGNKKNIVDTVTLAKENEVELLCLPELCITGYGCEDQFLSNWIYQKAKNVLMEIIPHCNNIIVAIGLPIRHNDQNFNCTCLIQNGEILGFYAKQNLALDGVHYEPRWFKPWPKETIDSIEINDQTYAIGDLTFDYKEAKIGFEICEDAWRTDRPACRLYEKGVNVILNPSASHFAFNKTIDRYNLVLSSSYNFECSYVYANLLGNEAGRMIYDGEILIAQNGHLLNRNKLLSFDDINIIASDIDVLSKDKTNHIVPLEVDKNEEFVQAASLALFDYLRKSRSSGFTLSLSGGADSSTIAILVSEMIRRGLIELGKDEFVKKLGINITKELDGDLYANSISICKEILNCAYQGTVNSSNDTLQSAKELANEIGATFYHWNIDKEVESFTSKVENALNRKLDWSKDDIALQNIQARARSPIIWMIANIKNNLLLTTSNRSEGDVGYATMDGDTSGSISPIAAVDKHFIINWLKWAELHLGYQSLHYVNNLSPSAELRPLDQVQTDENDLMPYSILAKIERLAIKNYKSPVEVYDILNEQKAEAPHLLKEHITKFFRLWSRNQWKRERIAPSFHLDDFNVDPRTWCRFPILSSGFKEELEELNKL